MVSDKVLLSAYKKGWHESSSSSENIAGMTKEEQIAYQVGWVDATIGDVNTYIGLTGNKRILFDIRTAIKND